MGSGFVQHFLPGQRMVVSNYPNLISNTKITVMTAQEIQLRHDRGVSHFLYRMFMTPRRPAAPIAMPKVLFAIACASFELSLAIATFFTVLNFFDSC